MIYKVCTHHYFVCMYKILILNLLETQQFPPTYMHTNKKILSKIILGDVKHFYLYTLFKTLKSIKRNQDIKSSKSLLLCFKKFTFLKVIPANIV